MRPPIIEVRESNLLVLMAFGGVLNGNAARTPHNFLANRVRNVIDSNGALWVFAFQRTDHSGLRKVISTAVRNISSDYYSVASFPMVTIEAFHRIVESHLRSQNPDVRELAEKLLEPLAQCPSSDALGKHIGLLNL